MKDKKWLMKFIDNFIPDDFELTECSLTFREDGSATLWIANEPIEDGEQDE